jgi:hypothetical protein
MAANAALNPEVTLAYQLTAAEDAIVDALWWRPRTPRAVREAARRTCPPVVASLAYCRLLARGMIQIDGEGRMRLARRSSLRRRIVAAKDRRRRQRQTSLRWRALAKA